MKIQCDACKRAEAAVLCCADEAALCWSCDEKVHTANKVAGKHQRVPLLLPRTSSSSSSSSSSDPSSLICDICQGKAGYFFCLEDRSMLCRQCDLAIHTASPYVSSHRRFLISGVEVAFHQYFTDVGKINSSSASTSISKANSSSSMNPLSSLASTDSAVNKKSVEGDPIEYAVENMESLRPQWPWNEFFDGADELEKCYELQEPRSSS